MRKSMTDKLIVLGIDGFEPSLAKKFMDEGKMPNLKKFVEKGSAREDLVLVGGMPTVTPPMWTTLSTGAYPRTHGITAFFNQHPEKLDTVMYALDSRMCKAEPVWNAFAEAGKKTLVWHWPGSSWPPTSDNPNLAVVDGTAPPAINLGCGILDWQKIGVASSDFKEVLYRSHEKAQPGAGCIITDQDGTATKDYLATENNAEKEQSLQDSIVGAGEFKILVTSDEQTEIVQLGNVNVDTINSPIKDATGWVNSPEGAKEFSILTSSGLIRRPCLILKNDEDIYDRVAMYKSKKETEPIVILENDVYTTGIVDEIKVGEEDKTGNRNMRILELSPDGNYVKYFMSLAMDMNQDAMFHPKSLHKDLLDNVGPVPPICVTAGKHADQVEKLMLPTWDYYCQWQADCLTHLMDTEYEVIFTHLHNVDIIGHQLWHFAKHREEWGNDEKVYQGFIEYMYKQTDEYLERFLKYINEDWSIIITSDHGLITEENHPPILAEFGVNIPVMQELGYTVLKKDESGNDISEIDWEKTTALAVRSGHIYLNIKGRNPNGCVDPKDKYELEAKIISDLYNYRDKRTNKRVISIALRNKDALIIGMGGEESGDIIFFMEEGFNIIHADSLSTQKGYFETSVSPIFVAAGKGIKAGYTIERDIRQVDIAPTTAVLGGVRMPEQCEGAPIYQMFTEEY